MLRITLLEPYPGTLTFRFGYEVRVPMQFGAIVPELTAEFSRRDEALPAEAREYPVNWDNENERTALVPNEVAVHYFGDWRAGTDFEAERLGKIPKYNNERERVARTWGDFLYSDRAANGEPVKYATIRIRTPEMPKVEITNVNAAGNRVGEFAFRPHIFWRFDEMLDAAHKALFADYLKRRGQSLAQPTLDISQLSPEQIRELIKLAKSLPQASA